MTTPAMKQCTRCQTDKPATDYYAADRRHCITCERETARWRMGRADNRIKTAWRDAKRAAEKHGAYDDLTVEDLQYLFAVSGGKCAYSGKFTATPSVDHIQALAAGGANTLSNIIIVDISVNKRKGSTDPLQFWEEWFGFNTAHDLLRLIAARQGVPFSEVYAEWEQRQAAYNNAWYRRIMGDKGATG